jgi:hypothetical protein
MSSMASTSSDIAIMIPGFILLALGLIQIIFVVLNSKAKNDLKNHIALGVLQIIFGDIVAGILMLIKNKTCRKVGFILSILTCILLVLMGVVFIILGSTLFVSIY